MTLLQLLTFAEPYLGAPVPLALLGYLTVRVELHLRRTAELARKTAELEHVAHVAVRNTTDALRVHLEHLEEHHADAQ